MFISFLNKKFKNLHSVHTMTGRELWQSLSHVLFGGFLNLIFVRELFSSQKHRDENQLLTDIFTVQTGGLGLGASPGVKRRQLHPADSASATRQAQRTMTLFLAFGIF
jgi:hypothetical protein